jgi:hypothetical protein
MGKGLLAMWLRVLPWCLEAKVASASSALRCDGSALLIADAIVKVF